jgi:hypothetical protein
MHTMAFRLPHPCDHCGAMMDRSIPNGIRCPQCGHTQFDMGEDASCPCVKCQKGS